MRSSASPTRTRPLPPRVTGAKAENGDRVTVSFKGTIDGVAFEGGSAENIPVTIGSNTFIPGFEEQLIGIAAGETRVLKVTFPASYGNTELAGKPAEFETTASLIEAPQEAEINDEFAKTLGLESLDKLKDAARERMAAEFAGATRQRVKRILLDRLDETHRFEAPPSLVDQEFEVMWNSIKSEMEAGGKTFADEDTTEEAAKEEYRKIADRRVRLGLVLSEIGEKNKITVTDDEVGRAVIERARRCRVVKRKSGTSIATMPMRWPSFVRQSMRTRSSTSSSSLPTSPRRRFRVKNFTRMTRPRRAPPDAFSTAVSHESA